MTGHDPFARDLAAWLDREAAMTAPAGLHADAIERARRARQRPAWLVAVRGGTLAPLPAIRRVDRRALYLVAGTALLLTAVLAALVAGALRSDGMRLGRNGGIAYSFMTSPGSSAEEAHLVAADGTGDRPIGMWACPTFAAGGRTVAFVTNTHDGELMVADAEGASARAVPAANPWDYALSPDGEQIASTEGSVRPRPALWLTPVSGGPDRRVLEAPADPLESYAFPAWSPDGRRIAVAVMRDVSNGDNGGWYRTGIVVLDADGSNVHTVTSRPGTDGSGMVSWSPDGRHLAYLGLPDGSPLPSLGADTSGPPEGFYPPQDLFVVGVDGSDDRNVTGDGSSPEEVRWSPDGRHLAFRTLVDDTWHLATLPMSGPDALGRPSVGPAFDGGYAWSPDGTRLAYLHRIQRYDKSQPGRSAILTVDPEFREPPATVVELDRTITCVSWQWLAP